MNSYNPEKHHRRSIRLKEYDYSQAGMYFITICVNNRECLFGEITNDEMVLNDAGKIINDTWLKTSEIRPNIELNEFVVMPNHFHAIFTIIHSTTRRGELHSPSKENLPQNNLHDTNIGNPMLGEFNSPLQMRIRGTSQTVGAIVRGFKSSVTKRIGYVIWQRNYYAHIIRNYQSYQEISGYIINNPANWAKDKFFK